MEIFLHLSPIMLNTLSPGGPFLFFGNKTCVGLSRGPRDHENACQTNCPTKGAMKPQGDEQTAQHNLFALQIRSAQWPPMRMSHHYLPTKRICLDFQDLCLHTRNLRSFDCSREPRDLYKSYRWQFEDVTDQSLSTIWSQGIKGPLFPLNWSQLPLKNHLSPSFKIKNQIENLKYWPEIIEQHPEDEETHERNRRQR